MAHWSVARKLPGYYNPSAKNRGGCVRERVATPITSAVRVQGDVAYLILGNYGGTMKGGTVVCAFGGHCSRPFELRRKSNIPFDHTVAARTRSWELFSCHASLGRRNVFLSTSPLIIHQSIDYNFGRV